MTRGYLIALKTGAVAVCGCLPALAGTIPAAEYHSIISFNVTGGGAESTKEGSISYDYQDTYFNGYEIVHDQYVANVALTGGNQLTVDVHGDYRVTRTSSQAITIGSIKYYFAVTKKDPNAPDSPVPFLISAKAHVSVQKAGIGNASPTAEARVFYQHPSAQYQESLLYVHAVSYDNTRYSLDKTFAGLRAQPPGAVGLMRIECVANLGRWSAYATGAYQAIADPYVRIDPDFTVVVNGVTRPGTEVYGLEFSEGIGSGIPEPISARLILVALCCVLFIGRLPIAR